MKALTLTQPWATLVALGVKRIETRSWSTNFRGQVAIHAAKGFPEDARHVCWEEPFFRKSLGAFVDFGPYEDLGLGDLERFESMPLASIVAVGNLTAVRRIDPVSFDRFLANLENQQEIAFGNYDEGRYAWLLSDVRALPQAIPCKGALGLWTVPADVQAVISDQLGRPAA